MMRIGGGGVKESSVAVEWSGLLQVVSGVFASFLSRAGAGELPSSSIRSSWAWEKHCVSAGSERGRRQGENGSEAWSEMATVSTFFSVAGKTQSSLSTRERSWLALGPFGERVGWWGCGLGERKRERERGAGFIPPGQCTVS
jgi:hypothetical protein